MSRKKIITVTPSQLNAIVQMANDMYAMVGGGEPESDRIWSGYVKNVRKMLKNNGYDDQGQKVIKAKSAPKTGTVHTSGNKVPTALT